MTPHCYFCGCELKKYLWVTVPQKGGFSISVASCKACAEKEAEWE